MYEHSNCLRGRRETMKYIEERIMGKERIPIPLFAIGPDEIKLLVSLMAKVNVYLPNIYQPDLSRMKSMSKEFMAYMRKRGTPIDKYGGRKRVYEK